MGSLFKSELLKTAQIPLCPDEKRFGAGSGRHGGKRHKWLLELRGVSTPSLNFGPGSEAGSGGSEHESAPQV